MGNIGQSGVACANTTQIDPHIDLVCAFGQITKIELAALTDAEDMQCDAANLKDSIIAKTENEECTMPIENDVVTLLFETCENTKTCHLELDK